MQRRVMISLAMAVMLLAGQPAAAQDDNAEIRQLLAELGDDSFAARQAAMKKIWRSSALSVESLRQFAETADPDAAARLRRIIEHIELGITPETDPKVARLVFDFHRGDEGQKFTIMYELRDEGHSRLVMDLLWKLQDRSLRSDLANKAWKRGENVVHSVIKDNQLDDAQLLELDSLMDHELMWETHIEDCIVYWQLRGKSVERIALLEQLRAANQASDPQLKKLSWFYRMAGDPQRAVNVARDLSRPDPELVQRLLIENGDWSTLASNYRRHLEYEETHLATLCKKALFMDWAGDRAGFLEEIGKLAEQTGSEPANTTAILGLATLDEDLVVSRLDEMSPGFAFRVLTHMQQYDRAFALLDAPRDAAGRKQWFGQQVQTLHEHIGNYQSRDSTEDLVKATDLFGFLRHYAAHVGSLIDVEQSVELFELLAEGITYNGSWFRNWNGELFEELAQLPVGDRIWHFFEALEMNRDFNRAAKALFPDGASEAIVWYQMLADKIEDPNDRAQLIATLLRSPFAQPDETCDVEMLVTLAREHLSRYSPENQTNHLYHIGRTCDVLGYETLARDLWLQAGFEGEFRGFRMLASRAVRAGDWQTARSWFGQTCQINSTSTDQYLLGVCERELGDEASASQWQQLSRLGVLHSFDLYRLSYELDQLGLGDLSRELMELYVRGRSVHNNDLFYDFQYLATLLDDTHPDRAADAWAAALHFYLTYLDDSADSGNRYHVLATARHQALASDQLKRGEYQQAMTQLEKCVRLASSSSSLAERFVPLLEQSGRQEDADELFSMIASRYLQVLETYPRSALHHNNYAWACARCHKRLDDARRHAERAVELEPHNTSYLDTLAEVVFLQGDSARAIELIGQCIELNPFKQHYRDQMQRFSAGSGTSGEATDR